MSAVPATKARRIGDILLELGFATEDALAKAAKEHEKTGQPLGQILVEHGAITRLELASALAEQWSDESASIKLLPIPPPASAPRHPPEPHHDDDQYAARLQDAVAELALRVGAGAPQPTEEFDDRVTDLAERVEATVARTQRIEATLATLAESFEGVTGGVEEAFSTLQAGMAELTLDLARIDTTVAELTTHPADVPAADPALVARLEELGAAVAALADRTVADPAEVEGRLDALAARVENVVTPDEVVALHDTLVAFEQRLAALAEDAGSTAALDEQARSLAELRATVVELESRPIGDPALDERLARIETQFAERLAAKPDTTAIDALTARLDAGTDEQESLATAVAQLGVRVDEMTWRDDGASTRLEELQEQVQAVATALTDVRRELTAQEDAGARERVDELGASLADIRDDVAALAQSVPPAGRIEQIAERIDDLAAERDTQRVLAARLDALEGTLTADVVSPEDLSRAIAVAREDLTPAPAPLPDARIDDLARELASLHQELADVRESPAPAGSEPRVDQLALDIAALREQLAAAEPTGLEADPQLAARLDDLERRLDAPAATDPRVEQLVHEIEAVREQVSNAERTPLTDPVVASELDTLSRRLRFVDARLDEEMATSSEMTRVVDTLRAELASAGAPALKDTSEIEATIGVLVARVDELAASVATGTAAAAGPAAAELQRLVDERVEAQVAERVAALTQGVEERLAAAERQPRADGDVTGDTPGLDDLLERNRMTIERLGLHLGDHDRALAELMRTRNLPEKLEELAARVEEIAGGPPAGGQQAPGMRREIGASGLSEPSTGDVKALMRRVEDAEIASQADREKLMNRLERMASSIDWRLQRLEAEETAAASSDDD